MTEEMRLFTVRVYDDQDELRGEIPHIYAWNRREAYFSVMHQLREEYPNSVMWDSREEPMSAEQFYGPAIKWRSDSYPWGVQIPVKVRMRRRVTSDFPPVIMARAGEMYYAHTNSHGAVSVWIGEKKLGVKPGEFEVIEWINVGRYM